MKKVRFVAVAIALLALGLLGLAVVQSPTLSKQPQYAGDFLPTPIPTVTTGCPELEPCYGTDVYIQMARCAAAMVVSFVDREGC